MTTWMVPTPRGLPAEELDAQMHVTYGGVQALDFAATFRADLMFVDLATCVSPVGLGRNDGFFGDQGSPQNQ